MSQTQESWNGEYLEKKIDNPQKQTCYLEFLLTAIELVPGLAVGLFLAGVIDLG